MLWARKRLGMLHWGTPRASGWLAGSRLASSCAQMMMMMMMLLLSSGSHFAGELTGSWRGREILLVGFSWREGGWVLYPIEIVLQRGSRHNDDDDNNNNVNDNVNNSRKNYDTWSCNNESKTIIS